MNKDLPHLAIGLLALVFGGAAEELLPKIAGVGFPFLLMASIYMAANRAPWPMFLFAAAAGALEDGLSSLPFAASIAFFSLVAAFLYWTDLVRCTFAFAFPAYQLWLRMWTGGLDGGVFARLLLSIPVGAATAAATWQILQWLDRKGAVDEHGAR